MLILFHAYFSRFTFHKYFNFHNKQYGHPVNKCHGKPGTLCLSRSKLLNRLIIVHSFQSSSSIRNEPLSKISVDQTVPLPLQLCQVVLYSSLPFHWVLTTVTRIFLSSDVSIYKEIREFISIAAFLTFICDHYSFSFFKNACAIPVKEVFVRCFYGLSQQVMGEKSNSFISLNLYISILILFSIDLQWVQ